jgi:hypothetical protein
MNFGHEVVCGSSVFIAVFVAFRSTLKLPVGFDLIVTELQSYIWRGRFCFLFFFGSHQHVFGSCGFVVKTLSQSFIDELVNVALASASDSESE